ncbi:MAG TPA: energy transducer TonB [Terriglobales bacterium]|nr:energy transducer TonB [Terriglobales bacterium]
MRQFLRIATLLLLASALVLGTARPAPATHPQHFTPPDILTASDIPYPATTVAAGVVTLAVNLDATGQIMNVQTLRDIPTVTTQATLAVQNWTYAPASLNGKNVRSTLIVNIVFDPAFLESNNIPLGPPESFQPPNPKATSYTPPQLFTATFPPYPTNGLGSGAVVLDVAVNSQGKIAHVATVRDVPTLTAAAAAALQHWSFSAAIYGNTPLASKVVVAMVFRNPATALP